MNVNAKDETDADPTARRPAVRGCAWRLLFVALLGTAVYFVHPWLFLLTGRWLDAGQPPRRTEAVYVLGGNLETRPFAAAAIYRAGLAEEVFVPRVADVDDLGPFVPPHELTRNMLMRLGVGPEDITILDRGIWNTYDEAQALQEHLDRHGDRTVAIVTDSFHARRVAWTFRKVLGPDSRAVTVYSISSDELAGDRWWKNRKGFETYLAEYLRLGFYWARYGSGLWWLSAGAVAVVAIVFWRRRRRQVAAANA